MWHPPKRRSTPQRATPFPKKCKLGWSWGIFPPASINLFAKSRWQKLLPKEAPAVDFGEGRGCFLWPKCHLFQTSHPNIQRGDLNYQTQTTPIPKRPKARSKGWREGEATFSANFRGRAVPRRSKLQTRCPRR